MPPPFEKTRRLWNACPLSRSDSHARFTAKAPPPPPPRLKPLLLPVPVLYSRRFQISKSGLRPTPLWSLRAAGVPLLLSAINGLAAVVRGRRARFFFSSGVVRKTEMDGGCFCVPPPHHHHHTCWSSSSIFQMRQRQNIFPLINLRPTTYQRRDFFTVAFESLNSDPASSECFPLCPTAPYSPNYFSLAAGNAAAPEPRNSLMQNH